MTKTNAKTDFINSVKRTIEMEERRRSLANSACPYFSLFDKD